MTVVTPIDKKAVELDDVLKKFKLLGYYHGLTLALTILAFMSNSINSSNYVFAAADVEYKCKDESFGNNTCTPAQNSTLTCTEFVYDSPNSFVEEFQLGCQDWKRTLVGTMHSFGYMVGLLFVGPLSDRWGRKKMIVITGVLGGVLGVSKSFSKWYWVYVALEFLETAIGDICSPFFMLTIEMVSSDRRLIYQMLCNYGYTIGGVLLPLMAYVFPYWRDLLKVLYTPTLLFFFYMFLLEESPRWLLSKGKKERAVAILETAAEKDNIKLDKTVLDKLPCEENESTDLLRLLRITFASKSLLKRFLVCLVWWTTSTFVNYGMSINSVSLQGNKYVNFALIGIVDIPGNMLVTYSLIKFKRKIPLAFSFITSAILCLIQPFVPTDLPWLSILLYMASKLMSTAYFNITYMYTSELFPTYTRNSMHALCSSIGRIGSIIAPQTPLLRHYWPGLPALVFGSTSLIAGLVTFLVPDVSDDALPDTIHQAEALGSKSSLKEQEAKETVFVIPTRHRTRL